MSFLQRVGRVLSQSEGAAALLLVAWVSWNAAAQSTYYVDGSVGDDNNSGTMASPFLTIQHAIDWSGNGDTVKVKRGILYTEALTIDGFTGFTLEAYGSGSKPVIRAGNTTINLLNSTDVTLDNLFLDGDHTHNIGLYIKDSDDIYVSYVDVDDYGQRNVVIYSVQQCTFFHCDITNNYDNGLSIDNGTGVFVRGVGTEDLLFWHCEMTGNALDGLETNPDPGGRITNLDVWSCNMSNNDRQGLRTQETDDIDVSGGDFDSNGASGIQIEAGSTDVTISNVTCENNGVSNLNEAGIWIYGSDGVTVTGATLNQNPYGIKIGHSEDVWLDDIDIDDPTNNGGGANELAGIKLSIGDSRNLYRQDGTPKISGMPFGGLRRIDMDNITFTNISASDYHIVYSGDDFEVYDGVPGPDSDGDGIANVIDVDNTGGTDANSDGIDDSPPCMMYRVKDVTFDAAQPANFLLWRDFIVNETAGYVDEIAEEIQWNN